MSETMAARIKLPLAVVGAIAVAEAAVLLMRPAQGGAAPVEVPASAYFSAAQVARAEAFRGPQVWLYALSLALGLAVLVLLLRRPPRRRPLVAGALLSLAVTGAGLPVAAISRQRAIDVGLVTQSWPGWARDVAVGAAISAVLAGLGAAVAVALIRRAPRAWWLPGALLVVVFAAAQTYAAPVVLDPLFNRFEPLGAGPTRSDVLALARRAGVDVGQVYRVDASRRTTAANAYVNGLGRTKRVVLYDTLLDRRGRDAFSREEVRLVVAHELGHVRHDDVLHGLVWVAIVAPFGLLAAAVMTRELSGATRATPVTDRTVPALAIALAVLVPAITMVSNQLSRAVEARADRFSLELTGRPAPFVGFQRRIALRNLADPAPGPVRTFLLATHPTTMQRIGIARAFERARTRALTLRSRSTPRPTRTRGGP